MRWHPWFYLQLLHIMFGHFDPTLPSNQEGKQAESFLLDEGGHWGKILSADEWDLEKSQIGRKWRVEQEGWMN